MASKQGSFHRRKNQPISSWPLLGCDREQLSHGSKHQAFFRFSLFLLVWLCLAGSAPCSAQLKTAAAAPSAANVTSSAASVTILHSDVSPLVASRENVSGVVESDSATHSVPATPLDSISTATFAKTSSKDAQNDASPELQSADSKSLVPLSTKRSSPLPVTSKTPTSVDSIPLVRETLSSSDSALDKHNKTELNTKQIDLHSSLPQTLVSLLPTESPSEATSLPSSSKAGLSVDKTVRRVALSAEPFAAPTDDSNSGDEFTEVPTLPEAGPFTSPGNDTPFTSSPSYPEGCNGGGGNAVAPGLTVEIIKNEGGNYCTQVKLSWDAGQNISHLELWRTNPDGTSYQMGWYSGGYAGDQWDYGFPLTRAEQDWTYELRAYDYDGNLVGSSSGSVTLVDEAPEITDAPGADYNGLGQGCARVKIVVGRLDDCDIVRYRIERKDSEEGEWHTVAEIDPQYYPVDPDNPDAPFEVEDYVNPEPDPGKTYWYRVIPVDYLGDGTASPAAEVTVIDVPPAAPAGLAIEEENHGQGCTQLTLSWSFTPDPENDCDIDHFIVWRNQVTNGTPGEWEQVTTVQGNGGYYPGEGGGGEGDNYSVQVYANPEPDPGITYQFRVDSVDRAGQSTEGETSEVTLIDEIPADVTDLDGAVTNEGKNCSRVELSWTAPEWPDNCDIVSYELRRSYDGGAEETITTVDSNTTSYTDYSIEPTPEGRTYTYTIVSIDRAGQESAGATFTTDSLVDDLPEEFSATADDHQGGIGCASVTIAISDEPECDFDHYEIYRSDENGEVLLTTLTSSWGGPPSYTDYSVEPLPDAGRTYTYRIVKVDRAGQETPFTVDVTLIDVPPTPYDFHLLGDPNHSQVFLGWTPTFECDIQKIELYGSADENAALTGDNKLLEQYDQGWTQVTHYNLIPDTTYYYTLVVYDRAGQTATSTLSATTEPSNTELGLKVFKNKKKQVPNPYYSPENPEYGNEFTIEDGPDWTAEVADNAKVSGKVWVVLESDIGALERFSSASNSGNNRLRITELPDEEHGVAHSLPNDEQGNPVPDADGLNPNYDLGVDNYTQWYRQGGDNGWELATVNEQGEGSTPTNPGQGGGTFRIAYLWQTKSPMPLGHNGKHTITLKEAMRFGGEDYGDEYPIGAPAPRTVDVRNLIVPQDSIATSDDGITANSDKRYFKYENPEDNPDTPYAHPIISFKIEEDGDSTNLYRYSIRIRSTSEPWTERSPVSQDDWIVGEETVDVVLNDGMFSDILTETGTYAYDISVWRVDNQGNLLLDGGQPAAKIDTVSSNHMSIPYGPMPQGHELIWDELIGKWYVSYFISSDRDASKMEIDFINPELTTMAPPRVPEEGTWLKTKQTAHENLEIFTDDADDPQGINRAVLTATDSHKNVYRDHCNHVTESVNDKKIYAFNLRWQTHRMASNDGNPPIWRIYDSFAKTLKPKWIKENRPIKWIANGYRLEDSGPEVYQLQDGKETFGGHYEEYYTTSPGRWYLTASNQVRFGIHQDMNDPALLKYYGNGVQWKLNSFNANGSLITTPNVTVATTGQQDAVFAFPNYSQRTPENFLVTATLRKPNGQESIQKLSATVRSHDFPDPDLETWRTEEGNQDYYDLIYGSGLGQNNTAGYDATVWANNLPGDIGGYVGPCLWNGVPLMAGKLCNDYYGENSPRNAAQHAYWNCLALKKLLENNSAMSLAQALTVTRGFMYAFEYDGLGHNRTNGNPATKGIPKDNEPCMDMFNNFIGQMAFEALKNSFSSPTRIPTEDELQNEIMFKMNPSMIANPDTDYTGVGGLMVLDTWQGSKTDMTRTNPKGSGLLVDSKYRLKSSEKPSGDPK